MPRQMGINDLGHIGRLGYKKKRKAHCQMGISVFGRIGGFVFRAARDNAHVDEYVVNDPIESAGWCLLLVLNTEGCRAGFPVVSASLNLFTLTSC